MNLDCPTLEVPQGDWGLSISYGYGNEDDDTDNGRYHYLLGDETAWHNGLCGKWMRVADHDLWTFPEILEPMQHNATVEILEGGCPDCDAPLREIVRTAGQALSTGQPVTDGLYSIHPKRWGLWVQAGYKNNLVHLGVHSVHDGECAPFFTSFCDYVEVPLMRRVGIALEYIRTEGAPTEGLQFCPTCMVRLKALSQAAFTLLYPNMRLEEV